MVHKQDIIDVTKILWNHDKELYNHGKDIVFAFVVRNIQNVTTYKLHDQQ